MVEFGLGSARLDSARLEASKLERPTLIPGLRSICSICISFGSRSNSRPPAKRAFGRNEMEDNYTSADS